MEITLKWNIWLRIYTDNKVYLNKFIYIPKVLSQFTWQPPYHWKNTEIFQAVFHKVLPNYCEP